MLCLVQFWHLVTTNNLVLCPAKCKVVFKYELQVSGTLFKSFSQTLTQGLPMNLLLKQNRVHMWTFYEEASYELDD